ncbi:MAG: D-alanyl-D-alanine carboxypeptidase family protein [Candidatus Binatus sp.]|uniref:D-alanyl-D-alanine carboxypeptidase family protein n=1 Tax=Candidatus Binatus sp. TaxID=2811406 RepID=UPI0027277F11|nr:D-alanyl-D-alanine carboxypeptidase family protein [Candidatus Binatus sp.]MDO8434227.1 D-alanyl-D-alanine carboxypeptidase family protein [Candidatus Binatus sp.]
MDTLSRSGVCLAPNLITRYVGAFVALAMLLAMLAPPNADAARHRRAKAAPAAKSAAPSDEEGATDAKKSGLMGPYAEAVVMEPVTGTVIFEANDHQPWPTASLAKMMLMLIVAEKLHDGSLKPTDQVTTSRSAAQMGGSQVYLKEGETFSLDDMMKAIVVHSANDASAAVAEYIGGSTDAFVMLMNQKAAALGMKDSHYYNVHGLPPAPGEQADVASAYDQALLARELLKYPDVLRWSAIDTAPFRGGSFVLRNTNHLVRTYQGCDGLKTGFYDKAGFNVVATAKRGDLRLVAVVLGTPHKLTNFKMASELLSQGFVNYQIHSVAKKGSPIAQVVAVSGGETDVIKPVWGSDAGVFQKRGDAKTDLKVDYNLPPSVAAPVKAGQQIGTANVLAGGKPVATIALLAPADIPKKTSMIKRLLGRL